MNTLPISAHAKRRGLNVSSDPASAVPTSTGEIAAGSVRGRAATSHSLSGGRSGALRELGEVGLAPLDVCVTTLLGFVGHVEEKIRVVRELLDARKAVFRGVEARLEQAQGERREGEHLAAPRDRLVLEPPEPHDGVHESHLERLLRVVLPAEEPDLLRLLRPDLAREEARAESAVEAADARAGLPEAGVVGRDREVADHV